MHKSEMELRPVVAPGSLLLIQDSAGARTIHTAAVGCRIAAADATIFQVLLLLSIELTTIEMSNSCTYLGAITAVLSAGIPSRRVLVMTIKINHNPQGKDYPHYMVVHILAV
jgi:hypothetical protein